MKTTRPNHLNINGEVADQSASSLGEMLYRQPSQPSVDGNTVDTEVEKAEFMRNAVQYQVSLDLLDSKVKNLLTAIRGE
jgi:flagellar basal-body rod protein FlgB